MSLLIIPYESSMAFSRVSTGIFLLITLVLLTPMILMSLHGQQYLTRAKVSHSSNDPGGSAASLSVTVTSKSPQQSSSPGSPADSPSVPPFILDANKQHQHDNNANSQSDGQNSKSPNKKGDIQSSVPSVLPPDIPFP